MSSRVVTTPPPVGAFPFNFVLVVLGLIDHIDKNRTLLTLRALGGGGVRPDSKKENRDCGSKKSPNAKFVVLS